MDDQFANLQRPDTNELFDSIRRILTFFVLFFGISRRIKHTEQHIYITQDCEIFAKYHSQSQEQLNQRD